MPGFARTVFTAALSVAALCMSASAADWIGQLPDDIKIRQLSIPGAHDAATGEGFTGGSAILAMFSGVTQSLTLAQQWDAGVRAFDLRPAYKADSDGALQIYHGILETRVAMKEAMGIIADKLHENPEEFAVVIVRHEDESDERAPEWADCMLQLIDTGFADIMVPFDPAITVGNARGKILFLTRDTFKSAFAGVITGTGHSENFADQNNGRISLARRYARLYAQDFYECQTAERKNAAVRAMLDYSLANPDDNSWVINNTSGYIGSAGTNSNIIALAADCNKATAEYLDAYNANGRTGIMMMDFAGSDKSGSTDVYGRQLVKSIIARNDYLQRSGLAETTIADSGDSPVYNLQGICVGHGNGRLRQLPPGVYIYRGHKYIVR